MILNFVDLFRNLMIVDFFFIFNKLYDFCHVFAWSATFFRNIRTDEFNEKSCIAIVENSLRVLKTSLIWRETMKRLISFIILRIAAVRCVKIKKMHLIRSYKNKHQTQITWTSIRWNRSNRWWFWTSFAMLFRN